MMNAHDELWSLLEALCEDRISAEEVARLESLVLSSKEARQLYVRYIDLHGSLYWNAAFAARTEDVLPTSKEFEMPAPAPEHGLTWERFADSALSELSTSDEPANISFLRQELPSTLTPVRSASSKSEILSPRRTRARHQRRLRILNRSLAAVASIVALLGLVYWNTGDGLRLASIWGPAHESMATPDGKPVLAEQANSGSNSDLPSEKLAALDHPRSPRQPVTLPLSTQGEAGQNVPPGDLARLGSNSEKTGTAPQTLVAEQQALADEAARVRALAESVSAFVKAPSKPSITLAYPAGGLSSWQVIQKIDSQLATTWKGRGITPARLATDATWHRRVYLDLIGHIPTAAESEAFLADNAPRKRERLIDRLLDDPGFARHQATIWTNLLVGRAPHEEADRDSLYDYLRVSFAGGRPWNRIVAELISAKGRSHENGATNFLLAHLNNNAIPAATMTSRLFLGRRAEHVEHLEEAFGESRRASFWELNSFFRQASSRPVLVLDRSSGKQVQVAHELFDLPVSGPVYYEVANGTSLAAFPRFGGQEVDDAGTTNRRQELARILAEDADRQLARAFVNRVWSQFLTLGFTSPVDDMGPHNPPSHPELLELLTTNFVREDYDVRELIRWITNSKPYQLAAVSNSDFAGSSLIERGEGHDFQHHLSRPLTLEQTFDSILVMESPVPGQQQFWAEAYQRRQSWLSQYILPVETEENTEVEIYSSLNESLSLMNGELTRGLLAAEPGTLLSEVLRNHPKDTDRAHALAMAIVSRPATDEEIAMVRRAAVKKTNQPRSREEQERATLDLWRDFAWALLNSSEFSLNH